jgi:uncharacterized protein (TIGR02646 family)
MRAIEKKPEPRELRDYRRQPDADYEGLDKDTKDKIKAQLLEEQGYLCAYCMKRIAIGHDQMKVEHWHSRSRYPAEQLDYSNLLGVCMGIEGNDRTCDTCKGDKDLKYNPADSRHRIEQQVRYLGNGKIESDEEEFDHELNEVLNLNADRLKKNRAAVIDVVNEVLGKKSGPRSAAFVKQKRDEWLTPDKEGKFRWYCGVAVYFLNKRLKRSVKRTPTP